MKPPLNLEKLTDSEKFEFIFLCRFRTTSPYFPLVEEKRLIKLIKKAQW